ncbi:translation initiation factor IF-2 [Sulfobacillus harzensis]|uniref:Translation initiation factor IF-2 n=1 Tax=Sulfobacillus harzensis TaxID=2729629 RepID=A0A7Y0L203_9FIRM|nr:translation initiation factor IF-2 [Sulfobacillus harzensis]NMP21831.1 translation initiation factor IF-2 [Sulfobacillus harzensis]
MTEKDKDKVRVYELAKELKLDSRRLIDLLHRLKVENIKNHMSTVEPDAVKTVRDIMEGKLPPEPKPAANHGPVGGPSRPRPAAPAPRMADRPSTAHPPAAHESRPNGRPSVPPRPNDRANYGRPYNNAAPRRDQTGPNASRPMGAERSNRPPYQSGPRPGMNERRGPGAPSGRPNAPMGNRPSGPRPGGARPGGPGPRPQSGGRPGGPPRGNRPLAVPPPPTTTRPNKDQNRRGGPNRERRSSFDEKRGNRNWMDDERYGNKRKKNHKSQERRQEVAMPPVQRRVVISGPIVVKDLAEQLGAKATDLIKRLIALGVMVGVNNELDKETAVIVATEMGAQVEERASVEEREEILLQGDEDREHELQERPPVVTVMGHVDHGKTSLLDKIRSTRVTASEAGGITQHIGASVIDWNGRSIVFLDTPGHEAFTAMRARGAQVTDVAVLVVAANDGVMPQTIEAINHAKAANVPIVVAINKIDLPDVNPERVRTELTEHGLVAEEWGGDTMMVPVSAHTGEGLDKLLESILLQADIMELKANPNRAASGTIIEAQLDRGRGPVATVLVSRGTLRVGDVFLSGSVYGRVRALINDRGERVKEVGPSMPVEVLGFNQLPEAGDDFVILEDERQAKSIADARASRSRQSSESGSRGVSLDEFYQRLKDEAMQDLNLVLKADVHGSAEALAQSLAKLSNDEARVRVLHIGVGSVTESDVMLAQASGAIIIGFGVSIESKARQLAEREHVDVRQYRIIYEVLDDVKQALTGMLTPKFQEVFLGRAEVREVFRVPKVGAVGGCYVTEGKILRSGQVRVVREGTVIHEGSIASLKRFKDDVREVASGYECGIGLEKFNDIKVGDILEVYTQEEVKAS